MLKTCNSFFVQTMKVVVGICHFFSILHVLASASFTPLGISSDGIVG